MQIAKFYEQTQHAKFNELIKNGHDRKTKRTFERRTTSSSTAYRSRGGVDSQVTRRKLELWRNFRKDGNTKIDGGGYLLVSHPLKIGRMEFLISGKLRNMKSGRPPVYTPELAEAICARLAQGESLLAICRDESMPSRTVVHEWIANNHEGFTDKYARAKELGLEVLAEESFDIADDGRNDWIERENQRTGQTYIALNEEAIARSKLRIETRKWYLSKLMPKKYGDQTKVELTGPDNGPVQVEHKGEAIATILAKAAERKAQQDKDIDGLV